MGVRLKRAYEPPSPDDGFRILVDRLWPRGLSKDHLRIDAWMKELAPSQELRKWFAHDPSRWETFAARYRQELEVPPARPLLDELKSRAKRQAITLVYCARDEQHNNAQVLAQLLTEKRRKPKRPRKPQR